MNRIKKGIFGATPLNIQYADISVELNLLIRYFIYEIVNEEKRTNNYKTLAS